MHLMNCSNCNISQRAKEHTCAPAFCWKCFTNSCLVRLGVRPPQRKTGTWVFEALLLVHIMCGMTVRVYTVFSFFVFNIANEKRISFSFFLLHFWKRKTKNEKGIRFSSFVRKYENEKRKDGIYTDLWRSAREVLRILFHKNRNIWSMCTWEEASYFKHITITDACKVEMFWKTFQ